MKKVVLIIIGVVFLVAIGGGIWFWNALQQPLYEPGRVRKNAQVSLVPPMQSGDKNYWLVENDVRLFHFVDGNGANVLYINGGPGIPILEPVAGLKSLAKEYRFHYYDQRGAGKSSRPIDKFLSSNYYENMQTLDRTLGLGAQIADIERIRQILGDEKIILIGHSFGGFCAALYAAEFPEHVRALVLIAPAEVLVMPPESGGLYEQVKPLLPDNLKAKYADYLKRYFNYGDLFSHNEADLAALNQEFYPYYEAALKSQGLTVPAANKPGEVGGWMVQAIFMSMGIQHDYRAALKSVTAPVLVIHGDKDLQPEKASRMYADLFPNAEFRVITNAGHFSFNDQPELFAQVVREFLAKIK